MQAVRNIVAALNRLLYARLPAADRRRAGGGAQPRRGPLAGPMRPRALPLVRMPDPAEESEYARAGVEPRLDEILRDPIVRLVIRADRLEPAQVRGVLRAVRRSAVLADPDGRH